MLGNHDAWTCLTKKRRKHPWAPDVHLTPSQDPAVNVRKQIAVNRENNLAWNRKDVPFKPVTIVGARPFSKVRCSRILRKRV
jgi:hypothetical protein